MLGLFSSLLCIHDLAYTISVPVWLELRYEKSSLETHNFRLGALRRLYMAQGDPGGGMGGVGPGGQDRLTLPTWTSKHFGNIIMELRYYQKVRKIGLFE